MKNRTNPLGPGPFNLLQSVFIFLTDQSSKEMYTQPPIREVKKKEIIHPSSSSVVADTFP